jgi:hypothetical protein
MVGPQAKEATDEDTEDIKLSVKKFLFRILKTVLNNGRSSGNIACCRFYKQI